MGGLPLRGSLMNRQLPWEKCMQWAEQGRQKTNDRGVEEGVASIAQHHMDENEADEEARHSPRGKMLVRLDAGASSGCTRDWLAPVTKVSCKCPVHVRRWSPL